MELININNLSKIYKKGDLKVEALKNVNLKIKKGELVAILGASGSGKSTLLNIIGMIDTPSSGSCIIESHNSTELSDKEKSNFRNKRIGFVVQQLALINDYTVEENVELPLEYAGIRKKNRDILVDDVLLKVGIHNKKYSTPKELSGGQCQRVAIARAIINNPDIILADEPTGSLDSETGQEIIELLKTFNKNGKTVIIITHDISIANKCNRKLFLSDGILTENN